MKTYNRIKYAGQLVTGILLLGGVSFSLLNKNPAFGYWLLIGAIISGARFYSLYQQARQDHRIADSRD